jgi:multiple sugar transport system permease protein
VNRRTATLVGNVLTYVALVAICVIMLLPVAWMVVSSLQGSGVATSLVPTSISFEGYVQVFQTTPFLQWYLNSLIVAVSSMLIILVMAIASSYALARLPFRGRRFYAITIVAIQLLPGIVIAIPLYVLLAQLHLVNTRQGLVVTLIVHSLPFAVWLLWSFMKGIPQELEEAAAVDGASRIQIIVRIVLPLSVPGIVTVGLFCFVRAWEEYLYPLLITPSDDVATLTVGAGRLAGPDNILWGQLMAYSTMMVIPMFLIFAFAQRYLLSGMTVGAVKG